MLAALRLKDYPKKQSVRRSRLIKTPGFLEIFSSLKVLAMNGIDCGYLGLLSSRNDPNIWDTRAVARMIEACPVLEELKVGFCNLSLLLYPLSSLIPTQTSKHLRALELRFLLVVEEPLLGVLEAHTHSLKTFNLHCIYLYKGSWLSVVERIHDGLSLAAVNSRSLYERSGEVLLEWDDDTPLIQTCFQSHPNKHIAGDADDYMCHRIDFNPIRRALESGFEDGFWPEGDLLNEGWLSSSVSLSIPDSLVKS